MLKGPGSAPEEASSAAGSTDSGDLRGLAELAVASSPASLRSGLAAPVVSPAGVVPPPLPRKRAAAPPPPPARPPAPCLPPPATPVAAPGRPPPTPEDSLSDRAKRMMKGRIRERHGGKLPQLRSRFEDGPAGAVGGPLSPLGPQRARKASSEPRVPRFAIISHVSVQMVMG